MESKQSSNLQKILPMLRVTGRAVLRLQLKITGGGKGMAAYRVSHQGRTYGTCFVFQVA